MTTRLPVESGPATPDPPYYVKGLALGIPAILLGIQLSGWLFFIPSITHGHPDFRAFYTAGYMSRTGHSRELYDYDAVKTFQDPLISHEQVAMPFIHPAYEALLFAPLSLMRYPTAYLAFLAVNLALLATSFRLLRPWMDTLAKVWRWLPATMFLVFIPVAVALMQGQDSILLLTLLAAAAVSLDRGQELTAGLLVGFGLFRFQIALPIAVLFLAWRRWRFSAGFALSAAVVGSVSLGLVGLAQTRLYARSLVSMSIGAASRAEQLRYAQPVGHMVNLRALIFGLADGRLSAFWIQAVTVVLSGMLLLWVAAWAPRKQRGADALLIAITASAAASYHLFTHDLSILLIPIAVTLNRFIGAEATGDVCGRLAARVSALMFVAPVCIAIIPFHAYLVSLPLCAFLFVLTALSPRRDQQYG